MTHQHEWSNDTVACHCRTCEISLDAYVRWLEGITRRVATMNALTEPSPPMRQLIEDARAHSIGSDLGPR